MVKGEKTVGAHSLDLQRKGPVKHSADEQMREQLKKYESEMYKCIKTNKNNYFTDFYIVVLVKKERLMQNVYRHYFFARKTCPTPDFDQTVYKYNKTEENLSFMWVIPDPAAVNYMSNNPLHVESDKRSLLKCVMEFTDGTLLRLSKKINGEKRDSNIIEK